MNYQPVMLCLLSAISLATTDTLSWDIVSTGGAKAGRCQGTTCQVLDGESVLVSIVWSFSNPTENPRIQISDVKKLLLPNQDTYFYICEDKTAPTGMNFTTKHCNYTIKNGNYKLKTYAFNVPKLPAPQRKSEGRFVILTLVKFGGNPDLQTVWPEKTVDVLQ